MRPARAAQETRQPRKRKRSGVGAPGGGGGGGGVIGRRVAAMIQPRGERRQVRAHEDDAALDLRQQQHVRRDDGPVPVTGLVRVGGVQLDELAQAQRRDGRADDAEREDEHEADYESKKTDR